MSTSSAAAEGDTNGYIYVVAAVAAMGGLLFGYGTGIISGALLFIVDDFHLSDTAQQIVVASLLLGAVFGALFGGPLADRIGRRPLLLAGTGGVTLSLIVLGLAYLLPPQTALVNFILVAGLMVYIASFAASLGICIWLLNSEVYPPGNPRQRLGHGRHHPLGA